MAEGLAEREAGPGRRIAYPYEPRPERFALDLAIQAAGCVAVPVGPGEIALPVDERELWQAAGSGPRGGDRLPWGGSLAREAARGGVVAAGRPVEADELVRRARRLEETVSGAAAGVAGAGGAGADRRAAAGAGGWAAARAGEGSATGCPSREIVVSAGPLADPAERDLLAWATLTGAAIVLEPAAERLVDTAAWARPTVFLGTAEEAGRLLDRAEAADREGWAGLRRRLRALIRAPGAPGLPFGRLHTLVVRGATSPTALAARAGERGAAVVDGRS